jgi:hypothetical protein
MECALEGEDNEVIADAGGVIKRESQSKGIELEKGVETPAEGAAGRFLQN